MRHDDLDWNVATAIRQERLLLLLFVAMFGLGVALASTGWTLAGTLLILSAVLGAVSRVLVGMLKTPGAD